MLRGSTAAAHERLRALLRTEPGPRVPLPLEILEMRREIPVMISRARIVALSKMSSNNAAFSVLPITPRRVDLR